MASTPTANLGYSKPVVGQCRGWGAIMNSNLDAIDGDITEVLAVIENLKTQVAELKEEVQALKAQLGE